MSSEFDVPHAHGTVISWGMGDYWAGVRPIGWDIWCQPFGSSQSCQSIYDDGLWNEALLTWARRMVQFATLTHTESEFLSALTKPDVDEWGLDVD